MFKNNYETEPIAYGWRDRNVFNGVRVSHFD